jgi:uncharacterized membrane protein
LRASVTLLLYVSLVLQHGPNGGFGPFQSWFWIILLIPILLVSVLLYRLFLPELKRVKTTEKLEEVVGDLVKESIEKDTSIKSESIERKVIQSKVEPIETALRLLESDEKRVVKTLIEAGGSMLQKEISWKTNFSRVKTHRILVRLIRRGVVNSEKYYNTNKITLADWLINQVQESNDEAEI